MITPPVSIDYNGYTITTDKNLMQPERIHKWLSEESYWSKHIPFDLVKRAFDNSFCFAAIKDGVQVAYGRFITDYASFAYMADVYVEEPHRGQGLSKKMLELVMEQEWMKGLRKIMLATLDAHGLYEQFGFVRMTNPGRFMEISRPAIYGDIQNLAQ